MRQAQVSEMDIPSGVKIDLSGKVAFVSAEQPTRGRIIRRFGGGKRLPYPVATYKARILVGASAL